MKKISMCFILPFAFLAGCGPVFLVPTHTPTASSLPTMEIASTSAMPTVTPVTESTAFPTLPPPNVQEAQLTEINMMDEISGWAWAVDRAGEQYLLRTSDGGLTWKDVSPGGSSKDSFFLDEQIAWVVLGDHRFVQTTDAGKTWKQIDPNLMAQLAWPPPDWIRVRFTDAKHGWLRGDITAAGARVSFYETQDGGATWHPADFKTLPNPYRHENAMNEIAFWVDTDVIYYDRERFILAVGDQEGPLEMFLSTDRGDSWKTIRLPASKTSDQSFDPYDRKIHSPVFFDPQNGVLAVTIWDGYANTTQLSIYGTSDGGITWSLLGGPSILQDTVVESGSEVLFLSPRDAVLRCGIHLCATHDSGNNWQIFDFGISIPAENNPFLQLDFIDPQNGWFLLRTYDDQHVWYSRLLRTNDGGVTWLEISPVINP